MNDGRDGGSGFSAETSTQGGQKMRAACARVRLQEQRVAAFEVASWAKAQVGIEEFDIPHSAFDILN